MAEGLPQIVSALGLVVGALLLLRAGLSRFGTSSPQRRMRLVETCSLGVRQRLHLVEVDGETLVLSVSHDAVRLVRRLPRAQSDAAAESAERKAPPARRAGAILSSLRLVLLCSLLSGALLAEPASAQAPPEPGTVTGLAAAIDDAAKPDRLGSTLQIVLLLTLVSVAPSILLMATCFTRVLIVLAFLRQALGVQQLPPNQVLTGLALFVTLFVMAPVGHRVHQEAVAPYIEGRLGDEEALARAQLPVREFLMDFTRESDLALFQDLSGAPASGDVGEVALWTLVPAYMLSELRTAFEIGFMIYLPFLVVDLVVASMLISMGMLVLPPIVISLPFKLMLFVLLDGWNLVVGSLVSGLGAG
ncbi:MAG: flagellar type III secretion system pore protein FliP [Myxococcota bacterium]|nr:flagellar type III secretion system pore protein FliP [Myxococcota bacterium]